MTKLHRRAPLAWLYISLPDEQWLEDQFWIWIHYGVGKVARGELLEALDLIAYLHNSCLP